MPSASGLYCLGNALVDYEFEIHDADLAQLGLNKGQMTLADAATFSRALTYLKDKYSYHYVSGGSAINSLMTYVRLGGTGGLSCLVGQDASGEFFVRELRAGGVQVDEQLATSATAATGRCLAMITPDKDRTMLTDLAINQQFALTAARAQARLSGFAAFYAEAYLVAADLPRQSLLTALYAARRQDKFIALSLSDVSIVEHFRAEVAELLAAPVNILFGNYNEFSSYTGKTALEEIFAALPRHIDCLVLTQGGADTQIQYQRNSTSPQTFSTAVAKTQVVDTLGAGDTYAAAWLYAYLERGCCWPAASKFAALAAAKVVSLFGPRLSAADCAKLAQGLNN